MGSGIGRIGTGASTLCLANMAEAAASAAPLSASVALAACSVSDGSLREAASDGPGAVAR